MQPKYTHNKSNIIQITEEAKRKSRHRLIGSIVLLFIALVVLLNVTAKVKPVTINPEIVEIKNTNASSPSTIASPNNSNASQAIANKPNSSAVIINNAVSSTPAVVATGNSTIIKESNNIQLHNNIAASTPQNGFKGAVTNKDNHPLPLQGTISPVIEQGQNKEPVPAKSVKPKKQAKPEDILNGLSDNNDAAPSNDEAPIVKAKNSKSYIQFAALKSQNKADELQKVLADHGINATIQPIQTDKGTLYRLRAGPFSRSEANDKLQKVTADGYSGIVTGN